MARRGAVAYSPVRVPAPTSGTTVGAARPETKVIAPVAPPGAVGANFTGAYSPSPA